jgi:hypothetical protein
MKLDIGTGVHQTGAMQRPWTPDDELPAPPTIEEAQRALGDPEARAALRRRLGSDQPPDPDLVARAERVDPEQAASVDEQIRRHRAGEPNDIRPVRPSQ